MKSLAKKILTGLMAGSLIFCGVSEICMARPVPPNKAQIEMQINEWAEGISEWSGVSVSDIKSAVNAGKTYEDIEFAAMLSRVSGKTFNQVMALKTDWADVMKKLGVTNEKYESVLKEIEAENIAKESNLDIATVEKLLADNYMPPAIFIAGRIAKASNKNVQEVLDMKKLNVRWIDIMEKLGVDKSAVFPNAEDDENLEEQLR